MEKKKYILEFLKDLNLNNSKDWMEANKNRYQTAKQYWLEEVEGMLQRLSEHDEHFTMFEPKDTVMRINNNRMFNPNLPIYKDHFAFSPMLKKDTYSRIFFTFGANGSMIGGGLHRPAKEILEKVRTAIDQNGQEFEKIVNNNDFLDYYGGLKKDDQELKSTPRGFDKDHPYGALLKRKNFSYAVVPSEEKLLSTDLSDVITEAFLKSKKVGELFQRITI
ncbi:MAG: DUF2461 domain-containing protein [Bacteroidota bacterium]